MPKLIRIMAVACIAALMALALAACSNANASSTAASGSASPQSEASDEGKSAAIEDVEAVLHKASESTFTNLAFTTKTETTATGVSANGQTSSQSATTTMKGQLDLSGSKPKLHMSYKAQSSSELNATEYDMFISADGLIVRQGDQLYQDTMSDTMLDSYAASITSAITADEIDAVLDMAASCKMTEENGKTTVTVTLDKNKLAQSNMVDMSSLPSNTEIATMIVTYDIDENNRFQTVRIMSSTSGTPTYRVNQTYEYSDYNATELPEWPDMNSYIAQSSGIMTDANGNMYIVGDDGQLYYVTSIGEDGTVTFNMGATSEAAVVEYYYEEALAETPALYATLADAEEAYYEMISEADTATEVEKSTSSETSETGTTDATNNESGEEEVGRAYITADDGTIHFLDEEGSQLFDNGDGTRYFIDRDGNFYFLADE